MHLHSVILFSIIVTIYGQSGLPPTPLFLRGLWCLAKYSQSSHAYIQTGQVFFYNNGTFTYNYIDNPSATWINHLVEVKAQNGSNTTYQLYSVTTKGPSPHANETLCYWRQRTPNGDIYPSLQANGSCTPTFEPDTSSDAILYTRNPTTCRYIDDENTQVVISNTSFEVGTLLNFDRELVSAKKKSVVFYGSSSIVKWTTLPDDFPDYTTLNRGFGGSTLNQCYFEFKRVVYPLEPSVLIVYAGENDIAGGATPESVQETFRKFIPTVRRFYPNVPVAYISVKPTPARAALMPKMNQTNVLIQEAIKQSFPDITFINVWPLMVLPNGEPNPDIFGPDHEHMNSLGYAIWTKIVTNYLESI
jgi:lysophospholipase L1-like esterase